jgi:hypothetical protein
MNVVRKDAEIVPVKIEKNKLPEPKNGKVVVPVYNFGDKTAEEKIVILLLSFHSSNTGW